MKHLFYLFCFLLSVTSNAQSKADTAATVESVFLKEKLVLSNPQYLQILQFTKTHFKKMDSVLRTTDTATKTAVLKKEKQEYNANIKSVLSNGQFGQYQQLVENRRKHIRDGAKNRKVRVVDADDDF